MNIGPKACQTRRKETKEESMKKQLQPLTPAALYARVSSDRQDVTCPWPPN